MYSKYHTIKVLENYFQSLTTPSTTTLSSMQSTLTSLQNRRYSFIFRALFGKQPPLHSPPKIRSSISVNFDLPISPLLVHKFILTSSTNASFLYPSPIFDFSIFAYYHPNNLNQKCFPHLSYLANSGCVEGPGS